MIYIIFAAGILLYFLWQVQYWDVSGFDNKQQTATSLAEWKLFVILKKILEGLICISPALQPFRCSLNKNMNTGEIQNWEGSKTVKMKTKWCCYVSNRWWRWWSWWCVRLPSAGCPTTSTSCCTSSFPRCLKNSSSSRFTWPSCGWLWAPPCTTPLSTAASTTGQSAPTHFITHLLQILKYLPRLQMYNVLMTQSRKTLYESSLSLFNTVISNMLSLREKVHAS